MKSSAMSTKPNLRAVSSGYSPASGAQWKFLGDIESIMWAMGDCRRPLQQSAKLIEDAMSRSVRLLMAEAQSVAESRGESWLGAEDLLFVLRKDRPTLLRLIRHMKIRDLRASTLGGAEPDELDTIEDPECSSKVPTTSTSKSRHYYLKKIFVQFDCEGDLLELLNDNSTDLIKHERARRAELQARHMETAEYLRYTEARQVSMFARTNPRRLRDHFCSGQFTNFRPSPLVLEILTFAAQEIIAIIMDAVHTLRRETNLSRRSLGHLMLKPTSNSLDSKLTSKFTTSSSKSKEVSMMLAQSIRQKRKFEESQQAETSVQPVAMGLDISQNIAVKPEEIAEAVRRLTQHRVAGGPRQLFGFIASPSKLRII